MTRLISKAVVVEGAAAAEDGLGRIEPAAPTAFTFDGERYEVEATLRTWRSSKVDRGDTYLKRHWFELRINGGATAVLYFDRGAKRGSARWWLYSIDEAEGAPE